MVQDTNIKGYDKGQSSVGLKWNPKTKVTLEGDKGPYGGKTVKIIANNGINFKQTFGNIVHWSDNACIRSKKKIMFSMIKAKPNRIDLINKFGNIVVSLSAPDEKTYNGIKQTLISLIGSAKCTIADTKAERQRKQHLQSLRRGGKRRKRRRKTRKYKKRKTKRKRKKTRKKKGGRTVCVNDAQCKAAKDADFSDFGQTRLTGKCTMASGECELGEIEVSDVEAAMVDLTPPALVRSPAMRSPAIQFGSFEPGVFDNLLGGRRKTKKRRRKKGGSNPEKDNCPICLEALKGNKPIIDVHKKPDNQEKEKTAGAGKHYFHLDCVNKLKRSIPGNKCPSCRQDMSYFEKLVDNNNNNNNYDPDAPLGRHGQRLARQGAIIAHEARRRLRFDPLAGRRAARERLEAEARSGRGLGGGKRRKTKKKRKR